MSERGGPTTQSGILYQNSIAALYLGRLCDETERPPCQTVVQVRVESPDHVDDTVVTFQDGHRLYIQAKEKVDKGSKAWLGLWLDFAEQFVDPTFQVGKDRLCLATSPMTAGFSTLYDLCFRASGSANAAEWLSRLSNEQREMLRGIRRAFADVNDEKMREQIARLMEEDEENLLIIFRHIDVEVMSLQSIERDCSYLWMPDSNEPKMKLFRLLRDRVGGEARRRKVFLAEPLRGDLTETDHVQFSRPLPIEDLRSAVWQCSNLLRHSKHTFADTEMHIPRSVVSEIVAWASASGPDKQIAMLLDRAGTGKSVVMRDVLHALDGDGVPTIAIKADLQLSGVSSSGELATKLDLPASLDRIAQRLAEYGRVIVLIDQVDALSLSLAHDQATLAVILDLVARLRTIKGARILLSCRTFDRKTDPGLKSIEIAEEFVVPELSDDELQEVFGVLRVDSDALLPATRTLLRVPLHLDLFARVLADGEASSGRAITTLQDLYDRLWDDVVLKEGLGTPEPDDRIAALHLVTDRMDRDRRTAVPRSIFETAEASRLLPAIRWLTSAGILVSDGRQLTFLHQTFFDYCYARRFMSRSDGLASAILDGDQGLFERPKLLQVINYLRGSDRRAYVRELNALLFAPTLRFHLRDLLLRWFGQLTDPTDEETQLLRQLLRDEEQRPHIFQRIEGNPAWFAKIMENPLRSLLSTGDGIVLDSQVIPYLRSLVDVAQDDIVGMIAPRFGESDA